MEFHISRAVRQRLKLDDLLFSYTGNIVFANVTASRRLAQGLTELRAAEAPSRKQEPVNAGALFAMGLIDELSHALIAKYRKEIDPAVLTEAIQHFAVQVKPEQLEKMLLRFTQEFPNTAVFRGEMTSAQWLAGATEDLPNREAAFEELMLLWLANANPAFAPFKVLFGDAELKQQTEYGSVTAALPEFFETRPPLDAELGSLLDALMAPVLASPESLTGQLDYIRDKWVPQLGDELKRVLLAVDTLREEELAIWMRFHPPGPDWHRHGEPGFGSEGFRGDEYIGYEGLDEEWVTGADGVRTRRRRYAADYQAPLHEYEAFSADQAWMPNVVLLAKNTYVWLEQLSKKYQRHIFRLDQIPDEELQTMAERGMTGLWLIGLWERSKASRTIKRLRGNADAVASAYSLQDYAIAEDLGGEAAYENLRDRARRAGLRLASDMVPNHMGLDSNWVIEHPDWFLSVWENPFPSYSFEGPDLSTDSRAEIKIEDHYYDQTDAAVVYRLRLHRDGSVRYVYHGNDGTTFAWNDTAQIDYSKAYVREQVMQVILAVARRFPIIRFDAAMVLAKRHVQRLWFPLPGAGGSIPSRAEHAIAQEQFDELMPLEFWREVVDRVAVEVPGTLLLAEAFWLLEGYFVRTLGMHRVYNSAFMNMLRDEENAKYRSYLKKTVEFDPDILKRYVNFMSNPDEKTAREQFGDGDKFFGVSVLLATLPGLPMFGHGQVEGFTERYGMDFKQARMEEQPQDWLVARHMQVVAPLLKQRWMFAESTHFVLYDLWTGAGTVDENVFVYSNRAGDARSLVFYNNAYQSTHGTIHVSVASMDKGSGELRQRTLGEGLAFGAEDGAVIAYKDMETGLEYLRRATDLRDHGLTLGLRGYQHIVFLNWREMRSTAEQPWDRLADALNGAGVYSVDEALSQLRLRPLHETLRQAVNAQTVEAFALMAGELLREGEQAPDLAAAGERIARYLEYGAAFARQAAEFSPLLGEGRTGDETLSESTQAALQLPLLATHLPKAQQAAALAVLPDVDTPATRVRAWAPVLAYVLLRSLPAQARAGDWFDELRLRSALAEQFSSMGLEGDAGWRAAARVRLLLTQEEGAEPTETVASEAFWRDGDVRWLTGANEAFGVWYFNQEQFDELACWMTLPALLHAAGQPEDGAAAAEKAAAVLEQLCSAAGAAEFTVEKLRASLAPQKQEAKAYEALPLAKEDPLVRKGGVVEAENEDLPLAEEAEIPAK